MLVIAAGTEGLCRFPITIIVLVALAEMSGLCGLSLQRLVLQASDEACKPIFHRYIALIPSVLVMTSAKELQAWPLVLHLA